ncbi:WD repeat-containing protein 87-like isoform X1 [Cydia fagiglandana]|uniref:WD repeat-containing protein 87-like isoform X1 n=1 Tax=Cydia fagiglandana TaxID=1458189 RepID=UPI002FEE2BDC
MDSEGSSSGLPGSDNQDSNEPTPPGTVISFKSTPPPLPRKLLPSSKGVENAKKRLRAFSIQKKTPITAVPLAKPASSAAGTGSTVLIGKLSSVKPVPPKVVEDEAKKLPKPPKPGANRKNFQDSYTELQKRTLAEIEDMKRKMELVDLGIPLGLICPSSTNEQAMPTKAMPPIKTFLDASKVDEIIRDAKKARAEGKEFKFDYQKILPDYDNPFQRKVKDDGEKEKEDAAEKEQTHKSPRPPKINRISASRSRDSKRKSDRYESSRRHSDRYDRPRKSDRDRHREKHTDKSKDRDSKKETKDSAKGGGPENVVEQDPKETDVNLSDYLVCDSWSLDNDDKTASPHVDDKSKATPTKENKSIEVDKTTKDLDKKKEDLEKEAILKAVDSPSLKKIEKLQPVNDSFEFEIDPNEDEILFDEDSKTEDFAKVKTKKSFDYSQDTNMSDSFADDNFLESVINEIKQENISDDESQDKGLVEYDSPVVDFKCQGTPELDDDSRQRLSRTSDYSDSYRSTDSGCKSTESGYRSTESGYTSKSDRQKRSEKKSKGRKDREKIIEEKEFLSVEKEEETERKVSRSMMVSLEMWDFVLKICQPLLFRHDKTKCYKQTRVQPSVWWATRPTACNCVRGRGVVLDELRAQRMALVDRVYSTDQISDGPFPTKRSWYPPLDQCLTENATVLSREEVPRVEGAPPQKEAPPLKDGALPHNESSVEGPRPRAEGSEVKPRVEGPEGRQRRPKGAGTPQHGDTQLLDREYQRFMEALEVAEAQVQSRSTTPVRAEDAEQKRAEEKEKVKLSSEGWSQESEVDEEVGNTSMGKKSRKQKGEEKEKARKRKRSPSTLSSATDDEEVKRKKAKKKMNKKSKTKLAKRRRTEKKYMKKLRDKQKKKKTKAVKISEEEEESPKKKLKDKKIKKKLKLKKIQKKKKKAKSSSSSSSSSSSDSDNRKKKRKNKKKKEEAFDVNILNNIKTEKLTDDEKCQKMIEDFSPRRQQEKRQEIINVKELGVQIKQEVEEEEGMEETEAMDDFDLSNNDEFMDAGNVEKNEFKEPQERLTPQRPEENSQCSSQDSAFSEKPPSYEKDESHLRPSSQNSNYSFNDVIASQTGLYNKGIEADDNEYEPENYDMYEQLAMAYQSDVASNQVPLPSEEGTRRIETVVRRRLGEIKCDWRAGAAPPPAAARAGAPRPSRWGLKPGEVNIVLTGGSDFTPEPVYRIDTITSRNDNSSGSYDEAYMDMYGAMDRLQYGDCFSATDAQSQSQQQSQSQEKDRRGTLDDRIDQALRHTVLGEIAMEPENKDADPDRDNREKGILITAGGGRGVKRVSFADGYKPGQDSDTEEPPVKKRLRSRRSGCAWPCPATHPDHVPLWDALPPPPPPPGSPPPPPRAAPPLHLLRRTPPHPLGLRPPHPQHKFDPNVPMPAFMPPEPPPGLISFQ